MSLTRRGAAAATVFRELTVRGICSVPTAPASASASRVSVASPLARSFNPEKGAP